MTIGKCVSHEGQSATKEQDTVQMMLKCLETLQDTMNPNGVVGPPQSALDHDYYSVLDPVFPNKI